MTSTTPAHHGAALPVLSLHWSPAPWFRRAATLVRSSLTAARDYESARTVSARRATLGRFAAQSH
jgi:hypothetical protein